MSETFRLSRDYCRDVFWRDSVDLSRLFISNPSCQENNVDLLWNNLVQVRGTYACIVCPAKMLRTTYRMNGFYEDSSTYVKQVAGYTAPKNCRNVDTI